ncbi:MAG: glycosyltransferase [Pseudomonadota bacterium]
MTLAENHPDYSIIIPAFNEADFLPSTLDSVQLTIQSVADAVGVSGEVIVVDNNSTDDTTSVAEAHALAENGLRVVFEPKNQISKARNAGAAVATSEKLIFVDADTELTPTLLLGALAALNDNAVGGGAMLAIDATHQGANFVTKLWNGFAKRAKYAAGCFLFCRKDAFRAVGGFSEEVFASEEIWLARGLKRWGKKHGAPFLILDQFVTTSARKLEWLSTYAMLKQILVILFFPFAVKYRRFCGAWYQRPNKPV